MGKPVASHHTGARRVNPLHSSHFSRQSRLSRSSQILEIAAEMPMINGKSLDTRFGKERVRHMSIAPSRIPADDK